MEVIIRTFELTRYLLPIFLVFTVIAVWPASVLAAGGKPRQRVITIDTALGAERVLLLRPSHPKAILIMLPGGTGRIGLTPDGDIRHGANFLVRTRQAWLRRDFAVLIPDSPRDRNLRGHRHGPAFAAIMARLVSVARREAAVPVFFVGTSQGTIAAINGAAHVHSSAIGGIVLTESVSMPGHLSTVTVFDSDPAAVRVPVLIVANRRDHCPVAPPAMAPSIARAFSASPSVTLRFVDGGVLRSSRCGSLSPHGYDGMESRVEALIASWLDSELATTGKNTRP